MGGIRQSYGGRQRLCMKCGTIWRMNKVGYGIMIGLALTLAATGIGLLYWRLKPIEADWWTLAWLTVWVVLFWPLLYYSVWRVYVNLKK
ncbi:MAG: hypothetical protein PCFJNLEI_01800 [Verrucomicrobiae bacterium]|nr:hypothetical protein [Verrucomicrobiae bacterium]